MRTFRTTIGILIACLTLTACGSNNQSNQQSKNSSLKAENSRLESKINKKHQQAKTQITDEEYALMGYLKLSSDGEDAQEAVNNLKDNQSNMHWRQNGNKYIIDFVAHATTITVHSKTVEVTYDDVEGDHMGNQNGHKIYSKVELSKDFSKFKGVLDQILHGNSKSSNKSSANDNPIGGGDPPHAPAPNSSSSREDDPDDFRERSSLGSQQSSIIPSTSNNGGSSSNTATSMDEQ